MISNERAIRYHHLEWVLGHPRFGMFMMALIAFSFTHNQLLALVLFVAFSIEIIFRLALFLREMKLIRTAHQPIRKLIYCF